MLYTNSARPTHNQKQRRIQHCVRFLPGKVLTSNSFGKFEAQEISEHILNLVFHLCKLLWQHLRDGLIRDYPL